MIQRNTNAQTNEQIHRRSFLYSLTCRSTRSRICAGQLCVRHHGRHHSRTIVVVALRCLLDDLWTSWHRTLRHVAGLYPAVGRAHPGRRHRCGVVSGLLARRRRSVGLSKKVCCSRSFIRLRSRLGRTLGHGKIAVGVESSNSSPVVCGRDIGGLRSHTGEARSAEMRSNRLFDTDAQGR